MRQRLSHKEEHTKHLISDDLSEPRTASHSQGKDFTTDILLGIKGGGISMILRTDPYTELDHAAA